MTAFPGRNSVTFDANVVRVDGMPIWNLSGINGRDTETGVLLDGLNERISSAVLGGHGKAPSAVEWLDENVGVLMSDSARELRYSCLTPTELHHALNRLTNPDHRPLHDGQDEEVHGWH